MLEGWARHPKSAQALAMRCRIVLAAADGLPSKDIAAQLGCSPQTVGRWRGRSLSVASMRCMMSRAPANHADARPSPRLEDAVASWPGLSEAEDLDGRAPTLALPAAFPGATQRRRVRRSARGCRRDQRAQSRDRVVALIAGMR